MDKHTVIEENAEKFWTWLHKRGGIAVWKSVNLSNPGESWSTPTLTEDGKPYPRPIWHAENNPSKVYTSPDDVEVSIPKEYKRFHVAVRRGDQGFSFKLTSPSSRKLEKEVAQAHEKTGKPSWYVFDYGSQEAVIMIDDKLIPLTEYARENGFNGV